MKIAYFARSAQNVTKAFPEANRAPRTIPQDSARLRLPARCAGNLLQNHSHDGLARRNKNTTAPTSDEPEQRYLSFAEKSSTCPNSFPHVAVFLTTNLPCARFPPPPSPLCPSRPGSPLSPPHSPMAFLTIGRKRATSPTDSGEKHRQSRGLRALEEVRL